MTTFSAVVEMVSGDSRIFSGESARLKCRIPDIHNTAWGYLWYRGSEKLPHFGEYFSLWNAHIKESGKYYCQGQRDTVVGKVHTLQSVPVEITVDGKIFISIIRNLLDSHVRTPFSYFCCSVRFRGYVFEEIEYNIDSVFYSVLSPETKTHCV